MKKQPQETHRPCVRRHLRQALHQQHRTSIHLLDQEIYSFHNKYHPKVMVTSVVQLFLLPLTC